MGEWKKILVAVDGTDTARRALRYLATMVGSVAGVEICLLHIAPEPPPYYYLEGHSLKEYALAKNAAAAVIFAEAREILSELGLSGGAVSCQNYLTASGESISDGILAVQKQGGYGTVVVGKRGVSKAEEFLFGSISNAVVQKCDFTVWVVGG